jgi:YidC/Oxa1 family membrane protein insertase
MTQTRSLLLIAWLFLAGWHWLQWNEFDAAPAGAAPAAALPTGATPGANAATPPLPDVEGATASAPLPGAPAATPAANTGPVFTVRNDVLELQVDAHGDVIGSRLLGYRQEKRADSPQVRLLQVDAAQRYVASAGLIVSPDGQRQDTLVPQFRPQAGGTEFALADGQASLHVPLVWTDAATGLRVTRTLSLERGSYLLTVDDTVANTGTTPRNVWPYVELQRTAPPPTPKLHGLTNPESFSFVGSAWYTPAEKFEKARFSDYGDTRPGSAMVTGGWIAMLQHHFLTAWVPAPAREQQFLTTTDQVGGQPLYKIRSVAAPLSVAPGTQATNQSRLWVGPKLQKPLVAVEPNLDRTLDYGKLYFISQPLFKYVLSPLHALTGNWGWAIILTVLLLKLALYPLSAKQFQSMAKMRALQPRIEALKERYGSGQEYQMAMMELYKKEKVNPVSGCLPILIPLPIFFALYWVLLETVELRQAPWMGWIQNLTAPDPYFILPVLNLAVMYLTQKMTPTPGMDPMQKKMMQFMPLIFGVMMAFFPAGLVLYWVTNGLLGLLQQWWMYRQKGGGPGARPAVAR